MIILSKYKDYYDYFVGIFGRDNHRIYDRRKVIQIEDIPSSAYEKEECELKFAICGVLYTMYFLNGKLYHSPKELEQLDKYLKEKLDSKYGFQVGFWSNKLKKNENKFQKQYEQQNGNPTDINIKKREPILLAYGPKYRNFSEPTWEVPLLKSFEFYNVIDAKTIYIDIETFLGWLVDNPPLPDKQTNVGKIVSHGFDKKRSFRPNMK